jgi:hypothetical protein
LAVSDSPSRMTPLLVGAALFISGRAHAELGGPLSSVMLDSGRMGARMASTAMGRYTRHDLTRDNGGRVHELTNADGQVFAVTWSGPGKPDLRSLLGRYFATFQAANETAGRTMHALRRPPQVNQSDLQIQTEGHMGWFHGVALIPSLAPPGFSARDLPVEP